jgi:N-acetylglucosamine-6-phosphate deacetylase
MASLIPAKAMGFANRLGNIAVGKQADLTIIDQDVNVRMTIVRGRIVYSNL